MRPSEPLVCEDYRLLLSVNLVFGFGEGLAFANEHDHSPAGGAEVDLAGFVAPIEKGPSRRDSSPERMHSLDPVHSMDALIRDMGPWIAQVLVLYVAYPMLGDILQIAVVLLVLPRQPGGFQSGLSC